MIKDKFIPVRSAIQYDRFIPFRSATDFDLDFGYAQMPTEGRESPVLIPPSRLAYRKSLAEALNMNSRILKFNTKPSTPIPEEIFSPPPVQSKPKRHIPEDSEKVLAAPGILDDFCLNLLDWGSSNVLSIALGSSVFLWNASDSSVSELVTVGEEEGPITSVSWAPDGCRIAIGLNNSNVQLWDSVSNKKLRTLKGGHQAGVCSLAWNYRILTTGGMDGRIVDNDIRVRSQSHVVGTYRGHQQEVCGLTWNVSGQHLASGGNDNLVHIWDRTMASSNSPTRWLHRFEEHSAAVKALAWCPFQRNLLASGGGVDDHCIKFWNTHTGACLSSVNTGSQVCALLWNKNERELLSSHGFSKNQLTLWKYPSMMKMAELTGHDSSVLFMTRSPNGCTVASASGDETLQLWNIFGTPQASKPAPKEKYIEPFAHCNRIHIR